MADKTRTELLSRLTTGDSSANKIATQLVIDILDSFVSNDDNVSLLVPPTYTVATMPATGTTGQVVYVSDGTELLALWDGDEWRYPTAKTVVGA